MLLRFVDKVRLCWMFFLFNTAQNILLLRACWCFLLICDWTLSETARGAKKNRAAHRRVNRASNNETQIDKPKFLQLFKPGILQFFFYLVWPLEIRVILFTWHFVLCVECVSEISHKFQWSKLDPLEWNHSLFVCPSLFEVWVDVARLNCTMGSFCPY